MTDSDTIQRLRDAEAQLDRLSSALLAEQRTIRELRATIHRQSDRLQLMTEHTESDGNTILAISQELAAVQRGDAPLIPAPQDLELRRPA